jgi:hypothetical protein
MALSQKGKKVVGDLEKIIRGLQEAEKAITSVKGEMDFVWEEVFDNCDANPLWDLGPEELVRNLQDAIAGLEDELQEIKEDPEFYELAE